MWAWFGCRGGVILCGSRRCRAIHTVHIMERGLGHYSTFFLTPKRTGGFRPPMNLLTLNQAVVKRRFKIYHFGDDYRGSRPRSSGYVSKHDGYISTYTHAPPVPSVSMICSANSRAFKVCLSIFETEPRPWGKRAPTWGCRGLSFTSAKRLAVVEQVQGGTLPLQGHVVWSDAEVRPDGELLHKIAVSGRGVQLSGSEVLP